MDKAMDDVSHLNGPDELEEPLEKDGRLPMELFLLYEELGIEPGEEEKEDMSPFDFELSEEFFLETTKGEINDQIAPNG